MKLHQCLKSARRSGASGFLVVLVVGLGSLVACQPTRQAVSQKEDGLSAAGFIVRLANTPERQAMLSRLPANHFVQFQRMGTVNYVYADPVVCNCLYVGTQEAYDKWKLLAQQQHLADEQPITQMYPDAAWNWGKWGPWAPYPGFNPDSPNLDR
jgi:hypothetical protein